MKNEHPVEIVPVELLPHGNADSLSIIPIFGYTYVGRTADWIGVTRGAYIPPDSIVDTRRPEFLFLAPEAKGLDSTVRIKARRLRGVVSFGLLIPVPDDTPLGEDWAERLGVEHYEPEMPHEAKAKGPVLGGDEERAPGVYAPRYRLEAFRRMHELFEPGEPVIATEKLDGSNSRYTCHKGQMFCGSRERWTREFCDYSHVTVEFLTSQGVTEEKAADIIFRLNERPSKRNIFWEALRDNPGLEQLCREHPDVVVYGEVYGNVNKIKYGLPRNRFAAFDITAGGEWLDPADARGNFEAYGVPAAPLVTPEPVPYDFDTLCELAEGLTLVEGAKAGTIREGVVVSPIRERSDPYLGRCKLKIVSGTFLERYR